MKPSPYRPETNSVHGCRFVDLHRVTDQRGNLTVCEWREDWPFVPKRVFFISGVPAATTRGEHAHQMCQQLMSCIKGSIRIVTDNGEVREDYLLSENGQALFVPAGIWATQVYESPDSVLVVFASHEYDEAEYIRNYDEFLEFRQRQ